MTEAEVLAVLDKLLKRYAKKFEFGIYSKEDLYQEGFIMALSAIDAYDPKIGPLENFLAKHIRRRFIDFKRDNYGRANDKCNTCAEFDDNCESCQKRKSTYLVRKNLNRALDIESINSDNESSLRDQYSIVSNLEEDELLRLVDKHLPIKYRADYLKMKDGAYIIKSLRDEIEQKILDIIEQYG